ncbi:Chemotaxis protein CheW [Candidatus Magnetomorum sp. HK-1]|nr:Chemotaxis protein CheW [Candidatus Magnetomorum sp. HK-1]
MKKSIKNTHLVCFKLEQRTYAIPLDYVDRVIRMVAVSPVPESPAWMMGVIDLQGKVIPVLDLKKRFKMSGQKIHPDNRMIVLHRQGKLYAITADEVTHVAETSQMKSNYTNDMMDDNIPLLSVLRENDYMIMVLDPERIIPSERSVTKIA